jgi:hypothetical protein
MKINLQYLFLVYLPKKLLNAYMENTLHGEKALNENNTNWKKLQILSDYPRWG